jgi:hypothetical protein
MNNLDLLFRSVFYAFSKFSLKPYLNLWLFAFPYNHVNEVLLEIVSNKDILIFSF